MNPNIDITLTGSYYSMKDTDNIQVRVVQENSDIEVVGWTNANKNMIDGTFLATINVPEGGWYNLQMRALNSTEEIIAIANGSSKWGVGINILCVGQSNMGGKALPPYTIADDLVSLYNGGWAHLVDPAFGLGGSIAPQLGNDISRFYHIPVGLIGVVSDGSPLIDTVDSNPIRYWAYRNADNPTDSATLYGRSIAKAREAGGVELILWNQGEADAKSNRTKEQYKASFAKLINNYRMDLYSAIPIFICQIGTTSIDYSEGYTAIRGAISELDNMNNKILMATTEMDFTRIDQFHYNTVSYNKMGDRVANSIQYFYGDSNYYRGPYIAGAKLVTGTKNVIDVTIAHRGGTDFSPNANITGFEVFDNGLNVTISSVERISPTTIRITIASDISSIATLRYLYGAQPVVTGMVKDNTPLSLPLENTIDLITISN